MGRLLVAHIERELGIRAPYLHGGVRQIQRDALVAGFEGDAGKPGILVVTVRAGGTGINLKSANHVFHFDRWWNPAVEDQATDRTHRIGQTRTVFVYTLVAAGTIEDKIDALIERKRALARSIVGGIKRRITELDDAALLDFVRLSIEDPPVEDGYRPAGPKEGSPS